MSKARLVITAIEVEGRTPAEVIAAYGVSRSWLYELRALAAQIIAPQRTDHRQHHRRRCPDAAATEAGTALP
jgi:hypothetical protein